MHKVGSEIKRFNAEPQEFNKLSGQKTREILSIVLGVLLLVMSFVFGNLQEENWYKSESEMYGVLKMCCIFVGLIELVLSPVLLYELSKTENKLSSTYIALYEDRIKGIHFNNSAMGVPFEIPYTDIIEATVLTGSAFSNKGNNICINATSGTYLCYAIEQKSIAVKMINEQKAKYDEMMRLNDSKQEFELSGMAKRYCTYCGTTLPKDASFCYKCGKSQKNLL